MEELSIKNSYKTLKSNRIQLLKPTVEDEVFYRKALAINSIWSFISEFKISEELILQKIDKYTNVIDANKGMFWNIYLENKPVGILSLHNWDVDHKKAEIGYWILPDFGNKGIVSEAIQLVLSYVFSNNLLNRIEAVVYENNSASNNLIKKNGFTTEALQREFLKIRGVYTNVYLYSILKKEWKE